MENDSDLDRSTICRVCGNFGSNDLWEMHFSHDDKKVMLIEAFNSFSSLDNVSNEELSSQKDRK